MLGPALRVVIHGGGDGIFFSLITNDLGPAEMECGLHPSICHRFELVTSISRFCDGNGGAGRNRTCDGHVATVPDPKASPGPRVLSRLRAIKVPWPGFAPGSAGYEPAILLLDDLGDFHSVTETHNGKWNSPLIAQGRRLRQRGGFDEAEPVKHWARGLQHESRLAQGVVAQNLQNSTNPPLD